MAKTDIRGHEVEIDEAPMKTWAAFNLFRSMEEAETVFSKADAAFKLCGMVSGLSEEDIVGICGGETADMGEVIGFALDVVKAAAPKN